MNECCSEYDKFHIKERAKNMSVNSVVLNNLLRILSYRKSLLTSESMSSKLDEKGKLVVDILYQQCNKELKELLAID